MTVILFIYIYIYKKELRSRNPRQALDILHHLLQTISTTHTGNTQTQTPFTIQELTTHLPALIPSQDMDSQMGSELLNQIFEEDIISLSGG